MPSMLLPYYWGFSGKAFVFHDLACIRLPRRSRGEGAETSPCSSPDPVTVRGTAFSPVSDSSQTSVCLRSLEQVERLRAIRTDPLWLQAELRRITGKMPVWEHGSGRQRLVLLVWEHRACNSTNRIESGSTRNLTIIRDDGCTDRVDGVWHFI